MLSPCIQDTADTQEVGLAVSRTEKTVSNVESRLEKEESLKILDWFCSFDHGLHLADILNKRAPETGTWFLKSPELMGWLKGTRKTLFCPGMPGAGKTFIASMVIDCLHRAFPDDRNVGVAFAFLNHQEKLSVTDLFSLLLKQLIPESAPKMVAAIYTYHRKRCTRPSLDEILTTLCKLVATYSKTFIIIDALDESSASDGCRQNFLTELFKIQDTVGANLLATGRPVPEIVEPFQRRKATFCEIRARDDDVHQFVTTQLETFEDCISEAPELGKQIADTITKATDGM